MIYKKCTWLLNKGICQKGLWYLFVQWDLGGASTKLWGLENCVRALSVNSSGHFNMMCQQYHFFLYFDMYRYPTGGFRICFPYVGKSLVHIFTPFGNVHHFDVFFYMIFQVVFRNQPSGSNLKFWLCQIDITIVTVSFRSFSEYPWITTWYIFTNGDC